MAAEPFRSTYLQMCPQVLVEVQSLHFLSIPDLEVSNSANLSFIARPRLRESFPGDESFICDTSSEAFALQSHHRKKSVTQMGQNFHKDKFLDIFMMRFTVKNPHVCAVCNKAFVPTVH